MRNKEFKPTYYSKSGDIAFNVLKQQVLKRVEELWPEKRQILVVKAVVMPALFFGFYASAILFATHAIIYYSCFALMGLMIVFNFLNVIHEAVHECLFSG